MWFNEYYDDDPYEREFEMADYERRRRRELQFEYEECEEYYLTRECNIKKSDLFEIKIRLNLLVNSVGLVSCDITVD